MVKLDLFDNDLWQIRSGVIGLSDFSYVCSKGKPERDITTDVDTRMFLFVPLPLSQPQSDSLPRGVRSIIGLCRALCQDAIVEAFLGVVVMFEDLVPCLA